MLAGVPTFASASASASLFFGSLCAPFTCSSNPLASFLLVAPAPCSRSTVTQIPLLLLVCPSGCCNSLENNSRPSCRLRLRVQQQHSTGLPLSSEGQGEWPVKHEHSLQFGLLLLLQLVQQLLQAGRRGCAAKRSTRWGRCLVLFLLVLLRLWRQRQGPPQTPHEVQL